MKTFRASILSVIVLAIAVLPACLRAAVVTPSLLATNAGSTRCIVTLRPDVEPDGFVQELARQPKLAGLLPERTYHYALKGFAATLDAAAIQHLQQDARVVAIEPDGLTRPLGVPAEPVDLPYPVVVPQGVRRMGINNFPIARIGYTNTMVDADVAVLDQGIDFSYTGYMLNLDGARAFGTCNPDEHGWDFDGHGTHVAGIIGGMDSGYGGVWGVAPGVRLWAVQVLCPDPGQDTWASFLAGMDYVVQHADQIEVANASLGGVAGGGAPGTAICEAVSNVVSHGIVFVAAAGNEHQDIAGPDGVFGTADDPLPAAAPEALTVSAMDPWYDDIALYSNFSGIIHENSPVRSPGKAIHLAAPGTHILSLYTNWEAAYMSGSSMSAAHVSGLVALYIAANGRAHNADDVHRIWQALIDAGLPQSQWRTASTPTDPDGNPEPLAFPSESWIPRPNLRSQSMTPQGLELAFQAVPGYTYTLQFCTSLNAAEPWINLTSTNRMDRLTTVTLTDPTVVGSRFYRVQRDPGLFSASTVPPGVQMATNAGSLGSAADGNGYGATTTQPGIVGSCFWFGLTNTDISGYELALVDVPFNAALNPGGPFTVEFWAKPPVLNNLVCPAASIDARYVSDRFGSLSLGNLSGWSFFCQTNWQFSVGSSTGWVATVSGGTVQPSAWHHVVGAYDGTNISLYVNGQPVADPASAIGFTPNANPSVQMAFGHVGWDQNGSFGGFSGWMDEVAFYTNALSTDIIAAHYDAATTNNAGYATQILLDQPVGYWPLDDAAPAGP